MEVIRIDKFYQNQLDALNILLPLLSSSAKPLTREDLERIINSDTTYLLMVKENEQYLGCLTLAVFTIPTGTRAWIEDVIVSDKARGRGVGIVLSTFAIELAKTLGAKTIDLTSRPSREAANSLYKKIGFEKRKTNVYRLTTP
jgi:ribosomal protein S18 acetylase RimI-like enzyme